MVAIRSDERLLPYRKPYLGSHEPFGQNGWRRYEPASFVEIHRQPARGQQANSASAPLHREHGAESREHTLGLTIWGLQPVFGRAVSARRASRSRDNRGIYDHPGHHYRSQQSLDFATIHVRRSLEVARHAFGLAARLIERLRITPTPLRRPCLVGIFPAMG